MPYQNVLIVGAGHAGGTVAAQLRQFGFSGRITLLGEEPIPPYQRPPLSKGWLKGEVDSEALALRPLTFYAEQEIAFRPGERVKQIDTASRHIETGQGERITYDVLILATGARPFPLNVPGTDLTGVHFLRTADDAEKIRLGLRPGSRVSIIGGGYVGLEVAASARLLGAEVNVIERESRLLARVANPILSQFFQSAHEAQGVTFRFNETVIGFNGHGLKVNQVQLASGDYLDCDMAIVGIGAMPNQELAQAAGIACDAGVIVDLEARTSAPDVFAIGDLTRRPVAQYDVLIRLESVPSALEQARIVASLLAGRQLPNPEVPWNWSDQYGLKLQIAGLSGDAEQTVVRGDPASNKFGLFHLKNGYLRAAEVVNSPGEFMMAKTFIAKQTPLDVTKLADESASIKSVSL